MDNRQSKITIIALLMISYLFTACEANSTPITNVQSPAIGSNESTPTPTPPNPPSINTFARPPLPGQMIVSAERNGRWDLYTTNPNDNTWRQLTNDGSARAPAITLDGTRIAFESHRDGSWKMYALDTSSGRVTRLTQATTFDGQPSWSPDGAQIAFTSTRQGDLDIWLAHADGTNPHDLTENSPAVDNAPAWSPDGNWIALTSWRTNTAQIFVIAPDGKQTFNLSQNKYNDQAPAWSPDGKEIAFVSDRDGQRAIYIADFTTSGLKNARRLTFSGWDDLPTWSPDGKWIAFVSPRQTHVSIYGIATTGGIPFAIATDLTHIRSVAWTNRVTPIAAITTTTPPALFTAPSPTTPAALIPLKDVYLAPSWGQMSNRVSGSFEALRARVKAEAGWDFLGTLSDMTRQLSGGVCGDGCQNLSWHKTGRAVDTRLAVESAGTPLLEIVREDQLGETYWRIYLRAAKQDGTQGEPLMEPPWNWTYYARWTLAPHLGGVTKPIPTGYYVDFTELAREYGWNRISSYDDETLSWKENNLGMEFWHFQNTNGLTWYAALRELHSLQILNTTFDWNVLLRQKEEPYLMRLKEIPAPPNAWQWTTLLP